MTEHEAAILIKELASLPSETEWVEFKHNDYNPQEIGENISAIANATALHRKSRGYLVWGIDDIAHSIVGTTFKPRQGKVGNEELENWLHRLLIPAAEFEIQELTLEGKSIVLFQIKPAFHTPIRFKETEFIRVGSYTKKLKEFPEKERTLWSIFSEESFEKKSACENISADEVLQQIDYPAFFELFGQGLPDNKDGIISRLVKEKVIIEKAQDRYDVTNLGAILFSKEIDSFSHLSRKAVRVIIYKGKNRTVSLKEQPGNKGYAVGFKGLLKYINDQLPRNEEIGQALRREVRMYPEIAIRELVANALIHQDFTLTGTSPMVEIFDDRIEITNPGVPLIDPLRFIDEPPQSRNEMLAALMRRLNICEERGSGIDKVISQVELFQLPAPDFQVTSNHTKAVLFAHKKFGEMDKNDRIRACYQHACLCLVSNKKMTNATLRSRFGIEEKNYAMASRIISETIKAKLIKPHDVGSESKKFARYIPFWA